MYFPPDFSEVKPEASDAEFWKLCEDRRLGVQECVQCQHLQHPPMEVCQNCQCHEMSFREVSGMGSVYTFTWIEHPSHESLRDYVPYNISSILLDGTEDIRFVSNVIDASSDELQIGTRVELDWENHPSGPAIPRFRISR